MTGIRAIGRPGATTHAEIELAAFGLFESHGFTDTTIEAIARAIGVSKRTVFRYYPSKNDIAWGQFSTTLADFRQRLGEIPQGLSLHAAVHQGILEFNRFPADAHPAHRTRMRLILETPELQAHSVLQYAAWRDVISEYAADRLGCAPTAHLPRLAGHVSLALALSAYEQWLADPAADLLATLDDGMSALQSYLQT